MPSSMPEMNRLQHGKLTTHQPDVTGVTTPKYFTSRICVYTLVRTAVDPIPDNDSSEEIAELDSS
jgi:hypothetical protein